MAAAILESAGLLILDDFSKSVVLLRGQKLHLGNGYFEQEHCFITRTHRTALAKGTRLLKIALRDHNRTTYWHAFDP